MQKESTPNEPILNENVKKGYKLQELIEIPNTPLAFTKLDELGWAAVMGKQRITDWFETKEALEEHTGGTENLEFLCSLIGNMIYAFKENDPDIKFEEKKEETFVEK